MTNFHITRYNVQETSLFNTHTIDSVFYVASSSPAPSDVKNLLAVTRIVAIITPVELELRNICTVQSSTRAA